MKKTIMRLAAAVLAAVLLSPVAFAANKVPKAPTRNYTLDGAEVLKKSTIRKVDGYNEELAETGAEIAVLTVDSTEERAIDSYAYDVFDTWGVGDSEKDNGVLFVLAISDADYYCVMGDGLADQFSRKELQKLLDKYAEPSFAKGDYDKCVLRFTEEMCDELKELYAPEAGSTSNSTGGSSVVAAVSQSEAAVSDSSAATTASQPESQPQMDSVSQPAESLVTGVVSVPSASEPEKSSGGMSTGMLMGVLLGLILFLVLMVRALFWSLGASHGRSGGPALRTPPPAEQTPRATAEERTPSKEIKTVRVGTQTRSPFHGGQSGKKKWGQNPFDDHPGGAGRRE